MLTKWGSSMEFITSYSTKEEIADAIRGVYGKSIEKEYKILYLGNAIIGIGDLEQIIKHTECNHSEFIPLGNSVYLASYED